MGGLVYYLMGPGRFNEHTDQRIVATWDWAPELHQPQRNASVCGFDVRDLVQDLNRPAQVGGVPLARPVEEVATRRRGPVWHCSLRNAPGDRVLSDAEWAEVAEDLMDRTGIAARGDYGGCRWVVIRHAEDHVHIAAMLVRQDTGRRVHPRNDYYRAREVCRDAERHLGITRTAAADRTAAPAATRAELEKAARRQVDETSRTWLRRAARVAAVQARDPEAFFRRLADLGVIVRPREMPRGNLVGYSVAAPGDENGAGLPVWFGGRHLARDLSLPQLQARWASAPPAPDPIPPAPHEHVTIGRAEQAEAVRQATYTARQAAAALHAGDPTIGPAFAHAAADLLTAVCTVTRRGAYPVPWTASDEFDRAAREPMVGQPRRWPPVARALRQAAWRLVAVRSVSRRKDDCGTAELVLALAALIAEIAAYHEERRHLDQAAAARRTDRLLARPIAAGTDNHSDPLRRPPTRGGPPRPTFTVAPGGSAARRPPMAQNPAGRVPGPVSDAAQRQGRSR